MKLFIVIIIVLAYWPMVVGRSLRGRRALAPIYDFSTNSCSFSDAFKMGRGEVQGLPTLHTADHNKAAGQSAAVSIWTGLQVTSDCVLTTIGLPSINLTHQQLQACWSYILYWWTTGSALLLEAVVNITAYLFFVFSVAILLLSKPNVQRHRPFTPPPRKPTFVSTVTRVPDSSGLVVDELVGQKQRSIYFFTLQGRLVLYSGPTTSDSPAEWTVLFHGYHSTCDAVKSGNQETQLDFADDYLLRFLLHGVSVNHSWTRYLPGIFIDLHREAIKEVYAGRKPTLVAKIGGLRGAPKRTLNEQPIQRRVLVKRPIWKPTFAPSIHRIGGKPAVYQPALPMRPLNPPAWIEQFTIEGRLVVYSGRPIADRPVQWSVLFDPRAHYHLTQYGDESSNCQRDMVDGYLLDVLLHVFSVYQPRSSYVFIIALDVPRELVNEPSRPTATHALFNITTSGLPPSETQAVPAIVDYSTGSIIAPVQVGVKTEIEVRVARDESDDRSLIGSASGHVPTNGENDAECYEEPHHPIDARGPGQVGIGPDTPSLEAPPFLGRTPLANRHIEEFSFTADPQPVEQGETVRQELHWPASVLADRARQRHAYHTGATAETRATHGAMEADDRMDEEVQQQGPPKRVKRRGGKKNALWKRKCRERRDRDDHNPEAGPSGLQ
ncbi:hypothetical protein FRC01_005114 [Tulasnella sp. 417]|nr:hypothetical protein FRC01_005114 [Tulasnella sp. 417]